MTLADLEAVVNKHMLLADKGIVKLLCSFMVAARMPINPPWMFIVSPPSGGKSTLLKAIEGCAGVYPLDDLTSNTFMSSMRGRDGESNSLLDVLMPNSVILFKDFTTILSKSQEDRGKIIGQMRKIYDGDYVKGSGNSGGQGNKWEGRTTVLAGVTGKVHTSLHQFADMGERFIMYNFHQPDRKAVTMMATDTDQMVETQAKEEMREAFANFIDHINIPEGENIPRIDPTTREELVDLAEMTTRARTPVERDFMDRDRPVKMVPEPEMPVRFAKQLIALSFGMMIVNGDNKLNALDREILYAIALDSITHMRHKCLRMLTKFRVVDTVGLGLRLDLKAASIRPHLEDLNLIGVINHTKAKGDRDQWELKENYRQLMSKFDNIEITDQALTEETVDEVKGPDPVTPEEAQAALIQDEMMVQEMLEIFGGNVVEPPPISSAPIPQ